MMLRQIRHFQTVVQENSFTEAAEKCHISQSGISQSIRALEEEIGAQLIERRNRSFTIIKRESRPDLCVRADESVF